MSLNKIYSSKGEWVGEIDTHKALYTTQRDFKKGQVFKYIPGNAIAIDRSVLQKIARDQVRFICVQVTNFNNEPSFYLLSSVENFISKSQTIKFGLHGLQRKMDMDKWTKLPIYSHVLDAMKKMNTSLKVFTDDE